MQPSPATRAAARALLAWLDGLELPPRARAPLRRELEIALGLREAAPGRGAALAGMRPAQLVAELYRDEGGAIRRVPAVGALVIELLREAIPPDAPLPEDERVNQQVLMLLDRSWKSFFTAIAAYRETPSAFTDAHL